MTDILQSLLYATVTAAFFMITLNEVRKWRKPWLFKGDTGPMGDVGSPDICHCKCCEGELTLSEENLDKPMYRTKEELYNLPPVSEDQ